MLFIQSLPSTKNKLVIHKNKLVILSEQSESKDPRFARNATILSAPGLASEAWEITPQLPW
jgi:hypothetical protein